MAGLTWAQYRAMLEGREFTVLGTFSRSESAIQRSEAVRLAHGCTCELPPAYDRLGAQRNARLARQAAARR